MQNLVLRRGEFTWFGGAIRGLGLGFCRLVGAWSFLAMGFRGCCVDRELLRWCRCRSRRLLGLRRWLLSCRRFWLRVFCGRFGLRFRFLLRSLLTLVRILCGLARLGCRALVLALALDARLCCA